APCRWGTTVRESTRPYAIACSSRSSPPSRPGGARGWACRSAGGSPRPTAVCSRSSRPRARAPGSRFGCQWRRAMRPRIGPRIDRLLDWREHPILFVDDEPENLRVFELTFRREFQVRTASSGEAALESLHQSPAALVLSDHRMEGMSGVELLAKVREIDPKTVRILVTAYGDAATLSDAINNGWIYRYVPKPWRPEEMRLTLRNGIEIYALDREREQLLFELDVLNRASKLLNRELELVPLLDLLLATLTTEFGYDGATVFLFDAGRERLQAVRSAPRDTPVALQLPALDVSAAAAPEFVRRLVEGRVEVVRAAELLNLEGPVRQLAAAIAAGRRMGIP